MCGINNVTVDCPAVNVVGRLVIGDDDGVDVSLDSRGDKTHPQLLCHHGVNDIVASTWYDFYIFPSGGDM